MSAQLSAYGRLGRDPRPVETSSGKAMTVASLAVTIESRESGETGEGTLWLDVVSFGRVADDLARHAKGDLVSVAGRMQPGIRRDGRGHAMARRGEFRPRRR